MRRSQAPNLSRRSHLELVNAIHGCVQRGQPDHTKGGMKHGLLSARRKEHVREICYNVGMRDVSRIFKLIETGDANASEQLVLLVYDDLRRLARAKLSAEAPGNTLSPTALVHEAYLRIVGEDDANRWNGPGHFYGAAAEAMRRILIDRARRKKSSRRGGDLKRRVLLEPDCPINPEDERLVDLDEALARLLEQQPAIGQLVKLRYFGGLTIVQAAAALNISPRTAKRHWVYAKAWLGREIQRNAPR
jgi:RNA polymerase sigma factor (TIGR02999 family)